MEERCVYLKSKQEGNLTSDGRQIFNCDIHSNCTVEGPSTPFASCADCQHLLFASHPDFKRSFLDHLVILDRMRVQTHALRNMLQKKPTFLVCGGPSAKTLPLHKLQQRGVWSLAVNNMAGFFRPSSFICADPPSKFHHGIWLDPCVMKFVPIPKLSGRRTKLRRKTGKEFRPLEIGVTECPNVWGFSRRSWLEPNDTFFTDKDAAWGNHNAGTIRTGLKKTVMTMLLAIRILYYLGSRRIFLVGVDFNMDPRAGLKENYAFGEKRDSSAITSNNNQFSIVNEWLMTMVQNKTFSRFGLELYNCNPTSGLRAFEHVPFEHAIADCLQGFPEEPFDLEGWYEK